jgi:hypothetical protein
VIDQSKFDKRKFRFIFSPDLLLNSFCSSVSFKDNGEPVATEFDLYFLAYRYITVKPLNTVKVCFLSNITPPPPPGPPALIGWLSISEFGIKEKNLSKLFYGKKNRTDIWESKS